MWGDSGSNLSTHYGSIAESIFFLDTGMFVMDWEATTGNYWTPDEKYIFFDCDTFETTEIYQYPCFLRRKADVDWNQGVIRSYGHMYTDDGKLVLYSREDQGYNWYILDTETMEISALATNIDIRPENVLAEGLIYATDQCFYNLNMEAVIDLSAYDIRWDEVNNIYFEYGECTFEASNELGTEFLVTIDAAGNVINEVKKTD